ncbi:hypothetical protein PHLGIDRAFT_68854 [Phlebiopsis gigantea 11061_1 CR5-6]|uniref:Nascent polypeptide-associated complex subunit alpha-like UBA domain-containing protein n=1 Tax=Phlebiopsis gigantea (strain 11061_1 CR5-6) TaxID=745531 RepID=A0A0C3S9Z4_PHLG1|nr:hypothetical protein PHLGIDRAFT_68854 [Phlebiopsis gigantea 11061_1 CR5-6]
MTVRSNGRPEPEVIVNFNDGLAYSKGKMEQAFHAGGLLEKPYKAAKDTLTVKREDVDLIVHELEIPRSKAEKALAANNGDVEKALLQLIS